MSAVGEILELGTLNVHFDIIPTAGRLFDFVITHYSFTSNLKEGMENYKINTKDILDIRSEISTMEGLGKIAFPFPKRNYELDDIKTQFYTYLATLLIELDPF